MENVHRCIGIWEIAGTSVCCAGEHTQKFRKLLMDHDEVRAVLVNMLVTEKYLWIR